MISVPRTGSDDLQISRAIPHKERTAKRSGKRYNKEVKKQLTMSLISDELGQASTKKKEFLPMYTTATWLPSFCKEQRRMFMVRAGIWVQKRRMMQFLSTMKDILSGIKSTSVRRS